MCVLCVCVCKLCQSQTHDATHTVVCSERRNASILLYLLYIYCWHSNANITWNWFHILSFFLLPLSQRNSKLISNKKKGAKCSTKGKVFLPLISLKQSTHIDTLIIHYLFSLYITFSTLFIIWLFTKHRNWCTGNQIIDNKLTFHKRTSWFLLLSLEKLFNNKIKIIYCLTL